MTRAQSPVGHRHLRAFPYLYGLVHAAVDTATVAVLFGSIAVYDLSPVSTTLMIVTYDLLAFAGQAIIGALADKLRWSRPVVVAGVGLTLCSVLLLRYDHVSAVVAAGVGNALFHVGAGALSLFVRPGRASAPGIFVGPGALGLGRGIWLGKQGALVEWPFVIALGICLVVAAVSKNPRISYAKPSSAPTIGGKTAAAALFLLLVSVSVRAFVGYAGTYQLPKQTAISFALAIAAFAGKSCGGVISDRLGWIRTSAGALLISAPLIAFGSATPWAIVPGMFLFQMTMPVTLVAVHQMMPQKPGLAFGLACLVLVLGAFAAFYLPIRPLFGPTLFLVTIALSALAIVRWLGLLKEHIPMVFRSTAEHTPRRAPV